MLPHCNNRQPLERVRKLASNAVCKIGYLGNVNIDRVRSLQILCSAIRDNPFYQLTYFTASSFEYLQQQGLVINNSSVEYISDDEQLLEELSSCDILFLPLALPHGIDRRIQVQTGFPTKVIEYLLSQVPILCHSDGGTFAEKFIINHNIGKVVSGGKYELFQGLKSICHNMAFREQVIENSRKTLSYFYGENVVARFKRELNC